MSSAFIQPLAQDAMHKHAALGELVSFIGYAPNALITMARCEGLLPVILELVGVALRSEGHLGSAFKFLVACQACKCAGSAYTTTHFVHSAHLAGVAMPKLAALDRFDTSALFSDAEKSALRLASLPLPLVDTIERDDAFTTASQFFDCDALAELVAVTATARWFSSWNGLINTELEAQPASVIAHVPWLRSLNVVQENQSGGARRASKRPTSQETGNV